MTRLLAPLVALLVALLCAATSLRAADADGGYLFVTFKGEQSPMTEQIYFATSDDGRAWTALHDAQPVLVSPLGEKGVRDPFLVRTHDGKGFVLLATDLSLATHHGKDEWKRAGQQGSKSIVIWTSPDLVHWSEPRLAPIAPDDAGCTWAPEAIYDESTGDYLVFWAALNASDHFARHRIWACRTSDFVSFGKPFVYLDKPDRVIDTDIVREGDSYYRFSKDEAHGTIFMETSANLMGPWQPMPNFSLAALRGYEGPECFRLTPATPGKSSTWCLVIDHFAKGAGYEPFTTDDLSTGDFKAGAGFTFPFRFRHGSIVPLSRAERDALEAAYPSRATTKPTTP